MTPYIRKIGPRYLVIVPDAPHARYPTVPCYHTAGVYYSESEAQALLTELTVSR